MCAGQWPPVGQGDAWLHRVTLTGAGCAYPASGGEGKWQLVGLAWLLCVVAHGQLCDPEIKQ